MKTQLQQTVALKFSSSNLAFDFEKAILNFLSFAIKQNFRA